jgi:HEAT repeat protein
MKQYVVCMLCLLSIESIAFSQSRRGEAPGAMPAEPAAPAPRKWPKLEEVLADLEQGDLEAKRVAVHELLSVWPRKGELDHDEGLQNSLKELMYGDDKEATRYACMALGKMNPSNTLPIALEALRSAKQRERFRGLCILQYMRFEPTDAVEEIEPILARLEELLLAADYHERQHIKYALSSLGERAYPIVAKGLQLPGNQGGRDFAKTLTQLRVRDRIVPDLIAALESGDVQRRLNAIYALTEIGENESGAASEALIKVLDDSRDPPRGETIAALEKMGPAARAAAPRLLDLAEEGDENATRALKKVTIGVENLDRALRILARIEEDRQYDLIQAICTAGPEATPQLTAALAVDSVSLRQRVMLVLANLGPGAIDAAPTLWKHFDAGDMKAAWALACITPTDQALAEKLVAKFAEAEWNGDIIGRSRFQSDALQPLIRMHDHVVPVILKGLSNDNHSVRYGCLRAIAPLQGEELKQAIPALRALLSESKVEGPRIPPGGTANSPPHRTPARMMFEERAQIVFSVPRGPEFTVDEYLEFLTELKRGADPEVVELVDSQINYVNRTKKEDMERTLRYLGPSAFGF